MTRDLIIGTLLSAALHALLPLSNWMFTGKKPEMRRIIEVIIPPHFPLPPLDVEPEFSEPAEGDAKPVDLAPPMQPDAPQLALPDSFVQPFQPPRPDGVVIADTHIVPTTRYPTVIDRTPVFDPSMLDQTPVPKFQTRPRYPHEMRRQGIPGEVLVDFIVDPNGEVRNATALRSSQREFEAAAVEAVSRWRFKPGRRAGRNVATHMQVPIVFTLNDN